MKKLRWTMHQKLKFMNVLITLLIWGREAHCTLDKILASHPATLGSILGIGVSKKLILLNLFSKCHHEITRQCTACTVDISSSLVDNWTHPVPASGKLLLRYSY